MSAAPTPPAGTPPPPRDLRLAPAGRDTVTVLTMRGDLVATKRIRRLADGTIEKSSYSQAKHFACRVVSLDDLRGLHNLLLMLASRRQDFIIRGTPVRGAAEQGAWRKTIYPNEDGPACFTHVSPGHWWACFDFDDLQLDFFCELPPSNEDLERIAKLARSRLPAQFHNAACVYRFSSSAGLDGWDKSSLHLWFWFSRPVACRSIKAWTKVAKMDGSVFGPAQPHYTSDPLFEGMDDPLEGRRLGVLDGFPEVDPPSDWLDFDGYLAKLAADAAALEAARPPALVLGPEQDASGLRRWCLKALEHACDEIRAQTKGGRHPTMLTCSFAMGGLVQYGGLTQDEAEAALIAAIQSVVPRDRHAKEADSVRELVALGAARPRDLSQVGRPRQVAAASVDSASPQAPAAAPPLPASELASILGFRQPASESEATGIRRLCSGFDPERTIDVADTAWGAPVDGHKVPHGYWMHGKATGSWKPNPKDPDEIKTFTVAHAPVVVSAKMKDLDTQATTLQVAWKSPAGEWARAALAKENAAQASKVVALAGADFPVTSGSAGFLAKYLDDYQATNYQRIKLLETTGVFGWVRGGARGFVWGKTHLQPDGSRVEIDVDDQSTWPPAGVAFRSAEGGADAQLCRALHAAGSFERWREAARGLYQHPRALLGIVVSLSSLLLEVLDAGNFVLDWGSSSGSGKTTAAHFAMSVWGEPKRLMTAWSTTEVAVEQALAMRGCIPMWLDDSKALKDRTLPSKVIYLVANGRGKARGGRAGNALAVSEFRTVLISTGEQALTSFDESGGARVRTLEVTTRPVAEGNAKLVRETTAIADANYGHAGPRAAAWLLERRSLWPVWRQQLRDRTAELTAQVATDHEGRVSATRALLELTHSLLCEQALRIGIPNPVDEVWAEITADAATATGAERALERVKALFGTESYRFKGTKASLANIAGSRIDWMGNILRSSEHPGGGSVAFVKEKLTDAMKTWGFAPDSMYQDWKAKGVTICENDRRTSRRDINGTSLPCIVFSFSKLDISASAISDGEVPGHTEPPYGRESGRETSTQSQIGGLS